MTPSAARAHLRLVSGQDAVVEVEPTSCRRVPTPDELASPPTLAELYRNWVRYVATLAYRLGARHDEVDDAVQDVFCALAQRLDELSNPHVIQGWLATVTVRVVRRRLLRHRARFLLGLGGEPDYDAIAGPDAPYEQRIVLRRLWAALDRLPAGQRLAWSLRHLEGDPVDVVAQRCEISLATAKRRIASAHARLKKELGYV